MTQDPNELRLEARRAMSAGDLMRAGQLYAAAVEAGPEVAAVHHDRGIFQKALGRLPEAEASFRKALSLEPGAVRTRHALGTVLLSQGRYREGWPYYEARHEMAELGPTKPQLPLPQWRGEPLAGKRLLMIGEQGLGDQIMHARFAPWLAAKGAEVTLHCRPSLARLFAFSFPDVDVVAAEGRMSVPHSDYWVMANSLVGVAGLERDEIPGQPYLKAPGVRSLGRRIGVAWRGDPSHPNDNNRSLQPDEAQMLLDLPGAISLMPEDTGATDLAETAEIVAGLDLVISVDTAVAHLAGAMGKPTWVLVPLLMTDWRWGVEGERTPWYPTVRLVRQMRPINWIQTLEAVRAEAAAF